MLRIDFVTDYVCPYCIVAKAALEQAMDEMRLTDEQAQIFVHPYELTPPEKEQVDTWNDPVRRAHYEVLREPITKLALSDMKLPPHLVPRPRTRLAWEAWLYACEQGRGSLWNACMYRAYFIHEEDIGDPELLLRYARVLCINPEGLQKAWDEHTYTARLLEMEKESKEVYQPKGVPTIWCNGQRMTVEEYTIDEMKEQLKAAMTGEQYQPAAEEGVHCDENGCG